MDENDDKVVTLVFLPTEIEATALAQELTRAGIEAQASGLLTAGFRAEAPGQVKVLVHERDLARAKELLDDYLASKQEIDWSQVDVGEPEDDQSI
ncbi:MAG: DUF2007 domain-containing protein [Planctomycetota bacterium]